MSAKLGVLVSASYSQLIQFWLHKALHSGNASTVRMVIIARVPLWDRSDSVTEPGKDTAPTLAGGILEAGIRKHNISTLCSKLGYRVLIP